MTDWADPEFLAELCLRSEVALWFCTRRYLCAGCGARVDRPPPRESEEPPECCGWEMVELPPAEYVA